MPGIETSMKMRSGWKLSCISTAMRPLSAKRRSMSMSRTIFWKTSWLVRLSSAASTRIWRCSDAAIGTAAATAAATGALSDWRWR